ncbi:MAG: QueT transporter family protein [Clostridia bacterium]|nr:QueT transporter family protein [Clostridia bacterium]
MKTKNKTATLVRAAMIASLYVILTFISNSAGLANGVIQLRLSEALTILPCFFPEAIAGLTVGCLLSNTLTACAMLDIIFGSIATLIGAVGTYLMRKHKILASLSPVVSNVIIVPFVLKYAYGLNDAWWFMALTVGLGEIASCMFLGLLVHSIITKTNKYL